MMLSMNRGKTQENIKAMTNYKDLSLTDLLLLHNNYVLHLSGSISGARFELLDRSDFEKVEEEIQRRLRDIDFVD